MSTNKDIRLGMVDAEISPGEMRKEIEERTGMEISPQYFSKAMAGTYHSIKSERVLRTAREILGEINRKEMTERRDFEK